MENKLKKYLIIIIIILVVFLAFAIPYSILSLKENKEYTPKKVKDYECAKKGNVCSFKEMYEGVEVNVEVAEGKTYTFSMIANDKNTMTLMLQHNLVEESDWHGELINMKGPQSALQIINEEVKNWTNIDYIEKYEYYDRGKTDAEKLCSSGILESGYECPKDATDTRGYNGLKIEKGEVTFLFNLPAVKDAEPGFTVATEGSILSKAKARLITIEEYEEFNTDDGLPSWLIEGLEKNEGYWTMTSSPAMTKGYYQGAISIVNKDKKAAIEAAYVKTDTEDDYKIGLRPVIKINKK